jgi:hypothetical protein
MLPDRKQLKPWQPQRLAVKGHGRGTPGSDAERGDLGVGERVAPFPERDRRNKDFLLAFDNEHIGPQGVRSIVRAISAPDSP